MALQGTVRDFGLAEIFQLIGMQRKTGTLTLENGRETVLVTFEHGQVVGAETLQRNLEDLLGTVLVRTGRITEAQLQEALKLQRKSLQRLGYLLVKQRFLSEAELQAALQLQVLQIVYRLFRWRDGRYQFVTTEHVDGAREFAPVPAETILMEGARMVDEWPILERRIRSGEMVFRRTSTGDALEAPMRSIVDSDGPAATEGPDISLTAEERRVLRLVDGRSTVQEIVDRSCLGEFDTYRTLYELLNRSLVEETSAPVAEVAAVTGAWIRHRATALVAVLLLVSAAAVATLPHNPLTPWRLAASGDEIARLKTYASRGRLERIQAALQVFYLDTGAMPPRLEVLASGGYLPASDLVDPWGREYAYELGRTGYVLRGTDGSGRNAATLTLEHRFSAAQRMVLLGSSAR